MAALRDSPYGAFNFQVTLGDGDEARAIGGFSEATGLGAETDSAGYRSGERPASPGRPVKPVPLVHSVAGGFKPGEVTLNRGLVASADLSRWLKEAQALGGGRRTVTIAVLDPARRPVAAFKLDNARPGKWVGPTLAAKGGGDVAIEELHLVHEGMAPA